MAVTTQHDLRTEFPTLAREGLVYLDSAATSQTPRRVLDAMQDYYEHHRASVHRGVYPIAAEATDLFEGARHRIAASWAATPAPRSSRATRRRP
jgi:cysteine desulfurase/selenocysteine lyase